MTLLRPHGLQSTRFLCPWDFSGKNTELGCHFLLQGIFPTKGLNIHLLNVQSAGRFFTAKPRWKPQLPIFHLIKNLFIKSNQLTNAPSQNTITSGIKASIKGFWWDTDVQSITPYVRRSRDPFIRVSNELPPTGCPRTLQVFVFSLEGEKQNTALFQ